MGGLTGSVGFAYDEADRLTQIAYPSGRTVDYTRDVLGQVTAIRLTHSDGITTETVVSGIAYAPFGPMTSLTYGNGIALSRDHDLDYRLTSQAAGGVQDLSFGYDGNGNLTALTDAIDGSRSQTLGYDALDRLTSAGDGYGSRSWSYDAVGNRLSSTGGGSETYDYAADSNRLIEYTTGSRYTVSYDANGNLTGDGYYGFSYGDHNRLTEARVLGSPVATYSYNGLGQRVTKDNDAVTHFVYDQAGRLIGEYDGTGATRKEVIRLNGVPVAVFAGSAVSYVHPDPLGTPRLITDGTGTVRWRWDSAPFGDTAADGDPDGDGSYAEFNLRFPGQYYDSETGLHYNYYRDYIPGFGRYLESDPIGLAGGLNTYGYAFQDPLRYTDPRGLNPACVPLVVADGPLPIGDAVCAGMLLYGAYILGQSMANNSDDSNVVPFPSPKDKAKDEAENCPADGGDDGFCEIAQKRLLGRQLRLAGMRGILSDIQYAQAAKVFNADATAHNLQCPGFRVALFPMS